MSKQYETVIGLEVHILCLLHCFRRSTKYPYLPGLHRYAGFPSGTEQTGG